MEAVHRTERRRNCRCCRSITRCWRWRTWTKRGSGSPRDHGLASIPGGVHPAWGTANRIIPLGSDYVELIVGGRSGRGATVGVRSRHPGVHGRRPRPLGGDLRRRHRRRVPPPSDLGIEVGSGSRTTTDGRKIRWHGAGLEEGVREPYLPFFISWDVPGRSHARSHGGAASGRRARGSSGSRWPAIPGGSTSGSGEPGAADRRRRRRRGRGYPFGDARRLADGDTLELRP